MDKNEGARPAATVASMGDGTDSDDSQPAGMGSDSRLGGGLDLAGAFRKFRQFGVDRRAPLAQLVGAQRGDSIALLHPVANRRLSDAERLRQCPARLENGNDMGGTHDHDLSMFKCAESSILFSEVPMLLSMAEHISDRIQRAIDESRFSPSDLARKVGVSPSAVSYWLKGSSIPTAVNVFSIADHTGFSPRWIATGKGPHKGEGTAVPLRMQLRQDEFNLLLIYQNLSDDLKSRLTDYARGLLDASPNRDNVHALMQAATGT